MKIGNSLVFYIKYLTENVSNMTPSPLPVHPIIFTIIGELMTIQSLSVHLEVLGATEYSNEN